MSAYEDVGLSYADFDANTKYAYLDLPSPITNAETFWVAFKVRFMGGTGNMIAFCLGRNYETVGDSVVFRYNTSTGAIVVGKTAGTTAQTATVSTISGGAVDGETHTVVLHVTPTVCTAYFDLLSTTASTASVSSVNGYTRITLNQRWISSGFVNAEVGATRFHWLGLYSNLSNSDIADIMSGVDPRSVGTRRTGSSFWSLDGSWAEESAGTPFTPVGSPTFVQPAFGNPLAVTESYLSLTDAQYAQVALTAITAPPSFRFGFKFRAVSGSSDPVLLTIGRKLAGADGFTVQLINSTGQLWIYRYRNGSVDGSAMIADFGASVYDGLDHTVWVNVSGATITTYIDSTTVASTFTGAGAFTVALSTLTINGEWDGTTVSKKGSNRFYWVGIYNTASPADRAAILTQGEHPASIGNSRAVYTLDGDGDEYTGSGSALTLNGGSFVTYGQRATLHKPLSFDLSFNLAVDVGR